MLVRLNPIVGAVLQAGSTVNLNPLHVVVVFAMIGPVVFLVEWLRAEPVCGCLHLYRNDLSVSDRDKIRARALYGDDAPTDAFPFAHDRQYIVLKMSVAVGGKV